MLHSLQKLGFLILLCSLNACIPINSGFPEPPPPEQTSATIMVLEPSPETKRATEWIALGKLDYAAGNYAQARDKFEKALSLEPKNEQAAFHLASSLGELGEIEASLKVFLTLLPSPGQVKTEDIYEKLALAYSYLGHCDEAGTYYQKINQTTPYCPRSFEALKHKTTADAAFRAGDFDSAKINYETALDLQPGFAEVQNNLASTLAETERYTEALALYLDLEDKTHKISTLHEDIAKTYSYLKQCDQAAIYYQKAGITDYTCPLVRGFFIGNMSDSPLSIQATQSLIERDH